MNQLKMTQLLGLAARARQVIKGQDTVLKSISKYPKHVIFIGNDAGENIQKKARDKAAFYNCTLIYVLDIDTLSKAIGSKYTTICLITDKGFNERFIEYLNS